MKLIWYKKFQAPSFAKGIFKSLKFAQLLQSQKINQLQFSNSENKGWEEFTQIYGLKRRSTFLACDGKTYFLDKIVNHVNRIYHKNLEKKKKVEPEQSQAKRKIREKKEFCVWQNSERYGFKKNYQDKHKTVTAQHYRE